MAPIGAAPIGATGATGATQGRIEEAASCSARGDAGRPAITGARLAGAGDGGLVSLLEQVDALTLQLAAGEKFERLGAIVQEHLLAGGRRLRARLALAVVDALGVEPAQAVAWASACELIHNASLVHDDLQDRDEVRRGKFSVWVRHGEAQAINAGDLMLMLPFVALESLSVDPGVRWELARVIARRAVEAVRGQSLEMTLLPTGRWDFGSYAEAARGKTAALFCLPVQGAAVLAGRGPDVARRIADAFGALGLLFQIQDDVIDLYGDKGRRRGADVRAGKVTALVAEHLALHPEDVEWVAAILGRPRHQTTDEDVDRMAEAFQSGGALARVLARIDAIAQELAWCPVLEAEPRLHAVAADLVERTIAPLGAIAGRTGAERGVRR